MKGVLTGALMLSVLVFARSQGQTIQPHILCSDEEVSVSPGDAGIIEYTSREQRFVPSSCTVTLKGFTERSHVSLFGLDRKQDNACRFNPEVIIQIAGDFYCLGGQVSCNQAIAALDENELKLTVLFNTSSPLPLGYKFTIPYYNTVSLCHTELTLPDNPTPRQLSGVYVSSFGAQKGGSEICDITINNLPAAESLVKYTVPLPHVFKEHSSSVQCSSLTGLQASVDKRNTGNMDKPSDLTGIFVIGFTLLRCEDLPRIPNAVVQKPPAPYLQGSTAIYICQQNFKIDNESLATVQCSIDIMTLEAVWQDVSQVKCLPEPGCVDKPVDLYGATYQLSEDNLTAVYTCLEGYSSSDSAADKTCVCSSSDAEYTLMTWSSPKFQCLPANCSIPPVPPNAIVSQDLTRADNSTIIYLCMDNYMRVEGDGVRTCTSSGQWTGEPLRCSRALSFDITMTSYAIAGVVLLLIVVIFICKTRKAPLRVKSTRKSLHIRDTSRLQLPNRSEILEDQEGGAMQEHPLIQLESPHSNSTANAFPSLSSSTYTYPHFNRTLEPTYSYAASPNRLLMELRNSRPQPQNNIEPAPPNRLEPLTSHISVPPAAPSTSHEPSVLPDSPLAPQLEPEKPAEYETIPSRTSRITLGSDTVGSARECYEAPRIISVASNPFGRPRMPLPS